MTSTTVTAASVSKPPGGRRQTLVEASSLVLTALLLGSNFWIFDLPPRIARTAGVRWAPPTISTLAFLVSLGVLCAIWRTPAVREGRWLLARHWRYAAIAVVAVGALWLLERTISGWITRLVLIAIDPYRADMLVQIQAAVERFWSGRDPYFVYRVPWELPLSYGPWLWMWYMVPYALGADLRVVTVLGHIFIPILLVVAAVTDAWAARYGRSAIFVLLAWAVLLNPLFDRFLEIGHTPAYWPLIALFALLLAGRRHLAAAVALGVLLGARTTMVSLVPVFFIYLWRNDRRAIPFSALLVAATVGISFGPFLLCDWRTLMFGMYTNYVRAVEGFVWTSTNWMDPTLGLTRLMVASGRGHDVGVAQVAVMTLVYALTAWRLRPGRSAGPWLCLALATFCLTTLWPVWYIFLDVFALGVAYFAADQCAALRRRAWTTLAVTAGIAAAVIFATLLLNPGVFYSIEPGHAPRWYLRSGFGPDERDGNGGFAWAERDTVHVRLPRGLRTDATILVECEPFNPPGAPVQRIGARLNDKPLGGFIVHEGWQTVAFRADRRAWRIGNNDVTLFFAYALPSASGRRFAVRVRRIAVTR